MKIKIQIILLISGLFFGSCRDWLDLQPEGQATGDELFTTGDGYRSVLAGIYQAMTVQKFVRGGTSIRYRGLYLPAIYLGLEL